MDVDRVAAAVIPLTYLVYSMRRLDTRHQLLLQTLLRLVLYDYYIYDYYMMISVGLINTANIISSSHRETCVMKLPIW